MKPLLLFLLAALASPVDGLMAASIAAPRAIACHTADCPALIVKAIATARAQFRVVAIRLTEADVLTALAAARRRGIDVEIVLDRSSNTQAPGMAVYNGAMFETDAGIPVWIADRRPGQEAIVIDRHIVLSGRMVFAAVKTDRSATGTLSVTDDPAKAQGVLADWQSLQRTGQRYVSTAR